MTRFFEKKFGILFIIFLTTAFCLGAYALHKQIVWGYDQARDAFEAFAIWHNFDLKILGPSSDIPGVYHGPLWFYLLAVFYFFAGGSPGPVPWLFYLFLFLSLPLVGYLAQKLFKDTKITFLSVGLYALSPLFLALTRWMSNPTIALIISPLLLVFLFEFLNRPGSIKAGLIGLLAAFLIQSDVAFCLFLILLPVYVLSFRVRLSLKNFLWFLIGLFAGLSPFIISEIKFGGRATFALLNFILKGESSTIPASGALLQFFDRIFDLLNYTILPVPKLIAVALIITILFLIKRLKIEKSKREIIFLLIWLANIFIFQLVSSGISGSAFVFVPSLAAVIILGSYFLVQLIKIYPLTLILIIILPVFQINQTLIWSKKQYSPLAVSQGAGLESEMQLIDYAYQSAKGQPFILNTLTNPLYINTTWAYLFEFYGNKKYGYLPFWAGKDQAGYLGNLPKKQNDTNLRYLILEPPHGIPDVYIAKTIYEEDKLSDLLEEKKFEQIIVQKREFHPNKPQIPVPESLLLAPKILKE